MLRLSDSNMKQCFKRLHLVQLVVDLASHVFGDVHWESVDLGDCGVVEEAGVGRGYGLGDVVVVLGWGVWDALVRHGDAGDARDEVEV